MPRRYLLTAAAAFFAALGVILFVAASSSQIQQPHLGRALQVPRVEVPKSVFDFGSMEPESRGKHSFEIRNVGTAPLTLHVAGTSCKCTVGGVSASQIAPGDKAQVTLEWHAKYKDQEYWQTAEVHTNDPVRPILTLRIEGKVRPRFNAEVAELVVSPMAPGNGATAQVVLFSPTWTDMEIVGVTTTLAGISTELLPAEDSDLKRLGATSARVLRVNIPDNLPSGEFRDAIRIQAAPKDRRLEVENLELSLRGQILPRYRILGPLDERNSLVLGQIPHGTGKSIRVLIKLRDEEQSLPVTSIETDPSFLKVSVAPHLEKEAATPGLFDLTIEVPADAPVCQYSGNPDGKLVIRTGHPRVPEISLKMNLSITP
jgi:hypothetical protein